MHPLEHLVRRIGLRVEYLEHTASRAAVAAGDLVAFAYPLDRSLAVTTRFDLARSLRLDGVPVLEPLRTHLLELPYGPDVAAPLLPGDGTVVTTWHAGTPSVPTTVDWYRLGVYLRSLHSSRRAAALPFLPELSPVRVRDAYPQAVAALGAARTEALVEMCRQAGPLLQGPQVLLHGDLFARNVAFTTAGPTLGAPDRLCVGPAVHDLAALVYSARSATHRGPWDHVELDAFAVGYDAALPSYAEAEVLVRGRLAAEAVISSAHGHLDRWVATNL